MNSTPNIGLTTFEAKDKPSWVRNWNQNMNKIDAAYQEVSERIDNIIVPETPNTLSIVKEYNYGTTKAGETVTVDNDGAYFVQFTANSNLPEGTPPYGIDVTLLINNKTFDKIGGSIYFRKTYLMNLKSGDVLSANWSISNRPEAQKIILIAPLTKLTIDNIEPIE